MRKLIVAIAAACVAACTSTAPKTMSGTIAPPPPSAKVIVVQPDVQLSILTAGGAAEPRADWTTAAKGNLAKALEDSLTAKNFSVASYDPNASEGRAAQLIKLHGAVGQSVLMYSYGITVLPTHPKSEFKWTLGPGTQELAQATNAQYALFTTAGGTFASAGRVAASVAFSLVGVGIPLGSQQMYASLIDLRSGEVIWFNVAVAGSDADMRTPEGAKLLITSLMKKAPI